MEENTIAALFRISIKCEGEAMKLYKALSVMFKGHQQARELFTSLAADEGSHIMGLEQLRDSLPEGLLKSPAPFHAMGIAKMFLDFSADDVIDKVNTLMDAYKAAINFEFSELNKLHELIFELHTEDKAQRDSLARRLKEHQGKLTEFRNSGVDMSYRP